LVIWFDSAKSTENERLEKKFLDFLSTKKCSFNLQFLRLYDIEDKFETEKKDKICIISSGMLSQNIIDKYDNNDSIVSISIYCKSVDFHNSKIYKKKGLVTKSYLDLLDHISHIIDIL